MEIKTITIKAEKEINEVLKRRNLLNNQNYVISNTKKIKKLLKHI
jgi:hypothetical protein